jgi:succinate dehydrogenase / fumarate reductase, cytochrome b subunit
VRQSRPVNLNLFTIRFPLPAIVSILHRVSGVVLFIFIPFVLWALSCSLTPDGFDALQNHFQNPIVKLFFWLIFIPYCFHLFAGIRHLLSDMHLGDTLKAGRLSAKLVFAATIVFIILAGFWLW